jgi:hypothetical protein
MSAHGFVTNDDQSHLGWGEDAPPAGLIFNPEATPAALAGLAAARAHRLHALIFFLSCQLKDNEAEVVSILEPMAHEIVLLIDELQRVVAPA